MLDDVTLSWLTGTGASAARSYWEAYGADAPAAAASGQAPPPVTVPVAVTTLPGEIWRTPRSRAELAHPTLTYSSEADAGGHFAAWEEPEPFTAELRAAFRPVHAPQVPDPRGRATPDPRPGRPGCLPGANAGTRGRGSA